MSQNLILELTKLCDKSCIHCTYSRLYTDSNASWDLQKLKEKLTDFNLARPDGWNLLLTGGEPLLYPSLFELLEFVKGLAKVRVILATNGTMLLKDPELISKLVQANVTEMLIPVELNQAAYLELRGEDLYHPLKRLITSINYLLPQLVIVMSLLLRQQDLKSNELTDFIRTHTFPPVRLIPHVPFEGSTEDTGINEKDISLLKDLIQKYNKEKIFSISENKGLSTFWSINE